MHLSTVWVVVFLAVVTLKDAESKALQLGYNDKDNDFHQLLMKRDVPEDRRGRCACAAPAMDHPVCGSNKKTYNNPVQLLCDVNCGRAPVLVVTFLVVVAFKNAESESSQKLRPNKFDRSSSRLLVKRNIPRDRRRPAACRCSVPSTYAPVCGSDGITYFNEEELNCEIDCERVHEDTEIAYWGRCRKRLCLHADCCCMLREDYKCDDSPVCASNNKTYNNHEIFNCEKECKRIPEDTRVVHQGKC